MRVLLCAEGVLCGSPPAPLTQPDPLLWTPNPQALFIMGSQLPSCSHRPETPAQMGARGGPEPDGDKPWGPGDAHGTLGKHLARTSCCDGRTRPGTRASPRCRTRPGPRVGRGSGPVSPSLARLSRLDAQPPRRLRTQARRRGDQPPGTPAPRRCPPSPVTAPSQVWRAVLGVCHLAGVPLARDRLRAALGPWNPNHRSFVVSPQPPGLPQRTSAELPGNSASHSLGIKRISLPSRGETALGF